MTRKLTTIGLILYVLILISQPCQDVFAAVSEYGESGIRVWAPSPTSEEAEPETCSPFCICSCCSLSVAYQTFTTSITIDTTVVTGIDSGVNYREPYDIPFQTSIWQPPKA